MEGERENCKDVWAKEDDFFFWAALTDWIEDTMLAHMWKRQLHWPQKSSAAVEGVGVVQLL